MGNKSSVESKKYGYTKREFYFIRHGQTLWGESLILAGPQDLELNSCGIQQAERAGKKLKAILGDKKSTNSIKIITSPLQRAIQTAKKISEITNFPIDSLEDGLKERYYGDYRLTESIKHTPCDAENPEKFKERVMRTLYNILNANSLSCLIIVSHQKVFECITEELSGKSSKLSQGGVAHFTTSDNKTWQLEIQDFGAE